MEFAVVALLLVVVVVVVVVLVLRSQLNKDPRVSGSRLASAGRYDEALAEFKRAQAVDPTSSVAWEGTSMVLYELKRYDEGLEAAGKAAALKSNSKIAWFWKAMCLKSLGRREEAAAACMRAKLSQDGSSARMENNVLTLLTTLVHNEAEVGDATAWAMIQAALEGKDAMDVNSKDVGKGGKTALHIAVEGRHPWTAKYLCQLGADKTATDPAGKTPVDYAKDGGFTEISEILATVGKETRPQ